MKLQKNNFNREISSTFEQGENKELVFSICSEQPYLRMDQNIGAYYQVLQVSPEAINDERLRNGISFLKDHELTSQLGIVKRWWIQDKKLYVSVKFSRSNFAKSIKADIEEGIRPWTSVGYFVQKFEKTGQIDGIPVLTAKRYSIYECSSVSTPADPSVGFNREIEIKSKEVDMKDEQTNKIDTSNELEQKSAEVENTNGQLENKDLAIETRSKETEVAKEEETKDLEEGKEAEDSEVKEAETCPECGKDPCECKAEDTEKDEAEQKEEKACSDKPQEKQIDVTESKEDEYLVQATQIRSLGQLSNQQQIAQQFILEKKSLADFKSHLKTINLQKKEDTTMEKKYFSIVHAIRNAGNLNKGDISQDYETQVVFENKRNLGIDDADIVMTTTELYQRALGPTSGKGAELINTDYLPGEFVPFDRPQLTIDKVGSYAIPSNGNPVSFTQCVSGATAAMYGLDGELSAGDMDFVLKTMTPHKAGVNIPIPYSLLLEGRPDVDALVQNDIVNALYQKRDEQVWTGTGANNQVAGIQSLTGINIISSGTSLSAGQAWGAMLSGVGAIRKANIFNENISYVMNTDTYITLKKTMKDANNAYGGWIIEDDKIGNYPVYVNNAISANTVLVGVGSDIAITDFKGLGILVDPYTYSNKQSLKITAWMSFDMVLRRLKSWTKITLTA